MRLFLIDHGVRSKAGHHFNAALGFKAEAERRRMGIFIYVHRDAPPDIVAALSARAAFPYTPYQRVSRDPLCNHLEDWMTLGPAFGGAGKALLADGVGRDDIVFLPTTQASEIFGLSLWLEQAYRGPSPFIVLSFHAVDFVNPQTGSLKYPATLYRYAAKRLVDRAGADRVLLTATNDVLAQQLTQVMPKPVETFPALKAYDLGGVPAAERRTGRSDGRILVSVLGHSFERKGVLLLPEVVRRCLAADPRIDFLVQASAEPPRSSEPHAPNPLLALRGEPRVEIVSDRLDEAEYVERLCRSDIVLCAYDHQAYVARISGIFAEANAFGRVSVVPSRSWMAAQLEAGCGAGTTFNAFTAEAIAAAVMEAVARLPTLQASAVASAAAWRREQSIPAYFERMVAAARAASA